MKRLGYFLFTAIIFLAMFANAYYFAGTHDENFCQNPTNLTDAEFNTVGGFSCSRLTACIYVITSLFNFEFPSGVPWAIVLFYAVVMLLLFLNMVIALISVAFQDVLDESDLQFWVDRFTVVVEVEGVTALSGVPCSMTKNIMMNCNLVRWCKSSLEFEERIERIDLNVFLWKSHWDSIKSDEKTFIHWWYGKSDQQDQQEVPKWWERLRFFFMKSQLKDIFIPGDVFENVLLGKNRSYNPTRIEKLSVLPFSIMLLVVSNAFVIVIFISGFVSFGLLWPKTFKRRLSAGNTEKKGTNADDHMNDVISAIRSENDALRIEIQDIKEGMQKILSVIESK